MIVDEVQTGFARTGKLFACEHAAIEPDLMPVAKSLAGGFPLSGVIGKAEIMDAVPPGGLGGTYGGSPLGCAAGLAVLDVIDSERLCQRAARLGEIIRTWGADLQSRNNAIGHVRGIGAMCAIELVHDGDAERPDAELTRAVAAAALAEGVLLLTCGVRGNVIRFLPPLTIDEAMLSDALATLGDVIGRLTRAVDKAS